MEEFYKNTARVNIYDVYRKCYDNDASDRIGTATLLNGEQKQYKRGYTAAEYSPWTVPEFLRERSHESLGIVPPCVFAKGVTDFFNDPEVRKDFNIVDQSNAWELCTGNIDYTPLAEASIWIYPILRNKYKILHFSGDTDGAVPTLGTRMWIDKLDWKINERFRPYENRDGQVAGFVEVRDGLTLATVHGVGHMAPQWSREANYHVVFNFINDLPL